MKRNILTIVIIAMSFINLIMTAVLIFVVVPTSNKTNALVTQVASIIDLELDYPEGYTPPETDVAVGDREAYELPEKLSANLKTGEDGKSHYAQFSVTIYMNSKAKDYKDLQPKVEANKAKIEEFVTDTFREYTVTEAQANISEIRSTVLDKIRSYFDSDFIIEVTFGSIIFS